MKSYWVSTSQKITRAMIVPRSLDSTGNLSAPPGRCQPRGHARSDWPGAWKGGRRGERGDGRNQSRLAPDEQGGGGAAAARGAYNVNTTATSSQQFCRGHLAQSAQTLSGNCCRSAA